MNKIIFRLALASMFCTFHCHSMIAQCAGHTPTSNQQWQVLPTLDLVLLNDEYKWYRFPILRERQYFRFTNVNLQTLPIEYIVFQLPDPNCPNPGSGQVGNGTITNSSDREDYVDGFTVGTGYGFIRFHSTENVDFKFAVMYGDPEGDGEEDFSSGNIPILSESAYVSTLAREPDPEVGVCLGPPSPIGVWFQFTALAGTYSNVSVASTNGFTARTEIFSGNPSECTSPSIENPTFESGAGGAWSGGYVPGTYYLYVYTDANAAPGFVNLTLNSSPVPLPAPNDAMADANLLSPTEYASYSFTHGAIKNGTLSPQPNVCTNEYSNTFYLGRDIWYKFTATQSKYYFIIKNIEDNIGDLTNIKMSVLTADGTSTIGSSCEQFFPMGATEAIKVIEGLTPGNVYNLRLAGYANNNSASTIHTEFDFCLARPDCIANDDCATATPFTAPQPGQNATLSGSTLCATYSTSGDCNTGPEQDAWWSFIATQTSYDFTLTTFDGVFTDNGGIELEINSDCSGTTVPGSCQDFFLNQTVSIVGLIIGQTYYLRLNGKLTEATFSLLIHAPLLSAEDECSVGTTLSVSSGCNFQHISTENSSQSPEGTCGSGNNDDVWYNFTATSPLIKFSVANISAIQGSVSYIYFGIYESCGGAMVACFALAESDEHIVHTLTNGQNYKLQMFTFGANNKGAFDVCLQSITPVSNDDCANAIAVIPQLYTTANPVPIAVNTLNASIGTIDCNGNPADDELWYSFTASSTSYLFKQSNFMVNSGTFNGADFVRIEFFETCGGASVGCYTLVPGYGRVVVFDIGQSYFYRVWTESDQLTATFDLLHLQLPNTPSNDYCDAPVSVPVSAFDAPCNTVAGSTFGGTYSNDSDCGSNSWDDVYFSFTADYTNIAISVDNITQLWGQSSGLHLLLFDACLSSYIGVCSYLLEGESVLYGDLVIGQTYYIKISSHDCVECYTSFDLCIKEGGPPNDAPNLNYAFNLNNGETIGGTTVNAGFEAPLGLPSCILPGTPIQDVWYYLDNYEHLNGAISISNASFDIKSAVYKGDINTPGNFQILPSTCGSGNRTITLNGLESGQYYWLRIWTENGSTGTFSVSYQDLTPTTAIVATPVSDQCTPGTSVLVNTTNINAGIPIMMGDDPILILYPNGNELGLVNVDFYISSTSRTDNQGIPYLQRNVAVTPQFQPSPGNPVLLRFLLTQDELNNLMNVPLENLMVTRVNNQPCAEAVSGSDNTLLSQPYAWANGNYLEGYYFDVLTDHFSSFYAHGGNVALQGSLLPVELLDFQAEIEGDNMALLSWRTATEHDNEGFFIEKSTDGIRFQTIAFVHGAGTSLAENSYAYLDKSFTTSAYYRLQQTDFDGARTYTDVVFLKKKDLGAGFSIFPNPAGDELTIHLSRATEGTCMVHIVDASGKKIREELWHSTNSTNHKTLSISNLPAGFYALVVYTPTGLMVENFVKR